MNTQANPWTQTIRLLSRGSAPPKLGNKTSRRARRRTALDQTDALGTGLSLHRAISLVEWTSSSTITIAWKDSTSCSYAAQIWSGANAKVPGICAMSGERINQGDRIFHPRHSNPAPVNVGAMILASAIAAAKPA